MALPVAGAVSRIVAGVVRWTFDPRRLVVREVIQNLADRFRRTAAESIPPPQVTVTFGTDRWDARLKSFAGRVEREVDRTLGREVKFAEQEIRRQTRHKSGRLRRSIFSKRLRDGSVEVGYDGSIAPHAVFIERGTRNRPGDHVLEKVLQRRGPRIRRALKAAMRRARR